MRVPHSPLAVALYSNALNIGRLALEKLLEKAVSPHLPAWWNDIPWDWVTGLLLAFLVGAVAQAAYYPRSAFRQWWRERGRSFELRSVDAAWGASGEAFDLCELKASVKFRKPCNAAFAVAVHYPHQPPEKGRQATIAPAKEYILGEEARITVATIPRDPTRPGYVGRDPGNPPILNHAGYMLRLLLFKDGKLAQSEDLFVDLMTRGSGTDGRFSYVWNGSPLIKHIAWETPPRDEPKTST